MVRPLGSRTRFAGSMRSQAIFYDACNSLIYNPKLQLCGLKKKKEIYFYADGVGRVVGALSCETGFAGLMLNKVIFHDARASLVQNLSCYYVA